MKFSIFLLPILAFTLIGLFPPIDGAKKGSISSTSAQQRASEHRDNNLSNYFKTKHVIQNGHTRRQLLSKNIPDSTKQEILQTYVGRPFNAQPNPAKPSAKLPHRAGLSGKGMNTNYILADPRTISKAVANGAIDGVDKHGVPAIKTAHKFPLIQAKTEFGSGPPGTGAGPKKNIFLKFNGGQLVRKEGIRVSHNGLGKINHFDVPIAKAPPRNVGS